MLLNRQRYLLALLAANGGIVGNRDFQKLLFLYCQNEDDHTYEFVPYKYGAFSFTSYADKRRLVEQGYLSSHGDWRLTAPGKAAAIVDADAHAKMSAFAARYARLRGDALVAATYRQYPYFAIRSEIAARVLAKDKAALEAIDKARSDIRSAGLFTIGYEGRSLEKYLNLLITHNITILCDVRRNPLSRKYGFSKTTLLKSCEGVGIRYEHLPELGIASDKRRELHTQSDYDLLFKEYEQASLPAQSNAIQLICNWVKSGERVALTCFEHAPEQCHRHCVAEAVERALVDKGLAQHL